MDENWIAVPGYESYYEVSDLGRVRSVDRFVAGRNGSEIFRKGKVLKPYLQRGPRKLYYAVELNRHSEGIRWKVHHLVLLAFVGPRPEGMWACHNDDDAENNALSNLRWDTPEANIEDARRNRRENPRKMIKACAANGHEFAEENIRIYRNKRLCRKCRVVISRRSRQRRKLKSIGVSPHNI